jgi:hypothetical protein
MELTLILLIFPTVLEEAKPVNSYAMTEEVSYLGKFGLGLWVTLRRPQYLDYMTLEVG